MKAGSESALVAACKQLLEVHGFLCWRQNTQGRWDPMRGSWLPTAGIVGTADLLAIEPPQGRLWAIECKMPGRYPTARQKLFLAAVEAVGGKAVVVRDLTELHRALSQSRGARS